MVRSFSFYNKKHYICIHTQSMQKRRRTFIAIDLKSFYASVECVERKLDALDTLLTVADASRTDKTICLAVSPALKSFGVGGRPRLFEVVRQVRDINRTRGNRGKSTSLKELHKHPEMAVDYMVAPPRMALYIDYSSRIYNIYLRHVAPEDMHVYSVDEVFIDATPYLSMLKISAHDFAMRMIRDVLAETGITATAGIGENMYLCKVAMDIVAKKMPPDKQGVRIAELTERSYREKLWEHRPITDFWRVGHGIASRLAQRGILTMGDIARCSLANQDALYSMLGVNAELLIDHAWGYEPVTMAQVKAYRPTTTSLSSGQVLTSPYPIEHARTVALEMTEALTLDIIEKKLCTSQLTLTIGYDTTSLDNPDVMARYTGRVGVDHYGRRVPEHSHGTANLNELTNSTSAISQAVCELFDRIANPLLLVRRLTICACQLEEENKIKRRQPPQQLELFVDYEEENRKEQEHISQLKRERKRSEAIINIKNRFGKNSILTGRNFDHGATQRQRNEQIGGHHQ